MKQKNTKAIANLQTLMALRLDEENRLLKIIASVNESAVNKSFARARFSELARDDVADLTALEKLKE
jgi:hypothetical protein